MSLSLLPGPPDSVVDPVCGMQVETANATASAEQAGQRVYFCSDRCAERFTAEHARAAPA